MLLVLVMARKFLKIFLFSWLDFLSKIVKNGQILVRFSGKVGQIVGQVFANFSQILIISTLFLVFLHEIFFGSKILLIL